ncbi:Alpha-N-acetylglucosaminidase [Lasiodiplodia hormozganensis]|uniref:Alpha-N-acetylglucosaminidase n=1 Tax=Lasiodiplodia hormozganensis TaxID=869390 RepID=A0AA39TQ82_9PEZI|nr:Alpha-N-acetylglucosaminidase [Lasiodiplodia hormozganensis]
MRFFSVVTVFVTTALSIAAASSPGAQGLVDLVKRRIPAHVDDFEFILTENSIADYDAYVVSTPTKGHVLYRYLADVVEVDIYWFIGSRLHLAPAELPDVNGTLSGASTVPWRYHFNTVTFSYTTAFWNWTDWELELDWLALRGVNLPLAWVGVERIIYDVFSEIGLTHSEISSFFSGPAFQAWNRFGNIQGSWPPGSELPMSWIDGQFALQKRIVRRMVELGMTPVLPSFTGFVPRAIARVLPDASIVNGSRWANFTSEYTNVTFLEPFDPAFSTLQKSFIDKQTAAYGNVSHIYTLDQYNENDPLSGDLDYLRNVSYGTWQSLKAADPQAVWLMQGWLFYVKQYDFWSDARVEAYLSGVEDDADMLILDLFSESFPQWQRTHSYYGKPWIWCQLHNFGGTMALYGQIENVTVDPVAALAASPSLVGYGLTMEAQEGNEVIYSLLLAQAWSRTPINTTQYFHDWATRRYHSPQSSPALLPPSLHTAWSTLRTTVYNNTAILAPAFASVPKALLETRPSLTAPSLVPPPLAPAAVLAAWKDVFNTTATAPEIWQSDNPALAYDAVDLTRQVLADAFAPLYAELVGAFNDSVGAGNASDAVGAIAAKGEKMVGLLGALGRVLGVSRHFCLGPWVKAARGWGGEVGEGEGGVADYLEYNARNQITLWGPNGDIKDYASKEWAGLVLGFYRERWRIFVEELVSAAAAGGSAYNESAVQERLVAFEQGWQMKRWGEGDDEGACEGEGEEVRDVIAQVAAEWPDVFGFE